MRLSKIQIVLGSVGLLFFILSVVRVFAIAPDWFKNNRWPEENNIAVISESIHITKADGIKSLGQLIREQSGIQIPDQPLLKIHFIVDPFNNALIFPRNDFQPEGFQWGILPGQDKTLLVPELPVSASQALDLSPAKTDGVCNFIVQFEFGPKVSRR